MINREIGSAAKYGPPTAPFTVQGAIVKAAEKVFLRAKLVPYGMLRRFLFS